LFSLLLVLTFALTALAQSVVVTPRKVSYKRIKPFSEYKKNVTVTYPKVSGLTTALNKKVESSISYEKVADLNIKEELTDIQWLEEATYKVNYNKNGILDVTLNVSGSGAYPSDYDKTVVVNLATGERARPADVFVNVAGLAAKCRRIQQAEIKRSLIDIKKNDPDTDDPESLFADTKFTVENLKDFTLNDRGTTFLYDYGFPHVIQALQPPGRYFISWKEIKPFIKQGGLLARFVR
jgi:Predicted membrane protein